MSQAQPAPPLSRRNTALLLAFAFVLPLLWFAPTLWHGLRSDDFLTLYYQDPDGGAAWGRAFSEFGRGWFGVRDLYRPLVSMSFAAQFAFGNGEAWLHVGNVLLLCATSCAVALLAVRLGKDRAWQAGAAAAVVVTLHGASVEPTAWVAARTAGLDVCFGAFAALAFVRRLQGAGGALPALAFAALALLSREGALALPVWLFALDLLQDPRRPWRRRLALHAGVAALVLGYFALRWLLLGVLTTAEAGHSFGSRLYTTGLRTLTWLAPPGPDGSVGWLPVLCLAALLVAARRAAGRSALLLAFGALMLLPTSSLHEPIGTMTGRLVFASVPPLAVAVGLLVAAAAPRVPRLLAWGAFGAMAFSLGSGSQAWLARYGEEDVVLANVRAGLETAADAAQSGPGRPLCASMLPGLPLLQAHMWGLLGVPPYASRDLAMAGLPEAVTQDLIAPELFGDVAAVHAVTAAGGVAVTWQPERAAFEALPPAPQAVVELVRTTDGRYGATQPLPASSFAMLEVELAMPAQQVHLRLAADLPGAWAFGERRRQDAAGLSRAQFDLSHSLAVLLQAGSGRPFAGFVLEANGAPLPPTAKVRLHATVPGAGEPAFAGRRVALDEWLAGLQPPRADLPLRLYVLSPLNQAMGSVLPGQPLALGPGHRARLELARDLRAGCLLHWFWQTPPEWEGTPFRSALDWCSLR